MTPSVHLVATLKNEGPYLLEWLAHHRAIGVSGFTLFSNDCSDGTNLMLNRLDTMGVIRHYDNPIGPGIDPQRRAYSRARRMPQVQSSDWVLVIDADEFLNITTGDHTLASLLAACPGADAISVPWRLMGSSGHVRMEDRPVTARFTHGAAMERPEHGLCWGFKTLFRPGAFDYFGVHRPKFEKRRDIIPPLRWVNASGKPLPASYAVKGWRFDDKSFGADFAQVNHYAVKSREEFLLKRLRGTANSKNRDRIDPGYWPKFDLNSMEDRSILAVNSAPLVADWLTDRDLSVLRRACLDSCRRVVADQLADPWARHFVETGAFEVEEA